MHGHVRPPWLGHLIALAPRRLVHNPASLLGPFVSEGMTVLEPGPGMGFFTLDLARLVGTTGTVVAVDTQPAMLDAIRRRADTANLGGRIDLRRVEDNRMALGDLDATVDFALAFAMVHEVPDPALFFREVATALRPGGKVLFAEPIFHVSGKKFAASIGMAENAGLQVESRPAIRISHAAVLIKNGSTEGDR
jgi:ubiquinone/menaquinone biosynthesis C-methylase UbiE